MAHELQGFQLYTVPPPPLLCLTVSEVVTSKKTAQLSRELYSQGQSDTVRVNPLKPGVSASVRVLRDFVDFASIPRAYTVVETGHPWGCCTPLTPCNSNCALSADHDTPHFGSKLKINA